MFLLAILAGSAAPPAALAWLEGEWCTVPAHGRQTCEYWGPARGGTMLGTSQTMRDGKTRDFEFMRIELTADGAVFHGAPRGAPAVAFREIAREKAGISFANPGHDIPSASAIGGAGRNWWRKSRWRTEASRCAGSIAGRADRS